MPLIKSKSDKAFSSNVEAEMNAGKPHDQALAIAYSVKNKAKYAKGGQIQEETEEIPQFQSVAEAILAKANAPVQTDDANLKEDYSDEDDIGLSIAQKILRRNK